MIQIFFGTGKGKTTAAIGTCLRSINIGKSVLCLQLYKTESNEIKFLKNLNLKFKHRSFSRKNGWVDFKNISDEDKKITEIAFKTALKNIISENFNLIILDEFLLADFFKIQTTFGLEKILLEAKNRNIDLILTGRYLDKKLIDYADLVTEMNSIKHPFEKGKLAVEGLDF